MVIQEYYLTLIRDRPTEFIGPFKSRREAGNFNRNKCRGQYMTYHYESHKLRPFKDQVSSKIISPKDFLSRRKKSAEEEKSSKGEEK